MTKPLIETHPLLCRKPTHGPCCTCQECGHSNDGTCICYFKDEIQKHTVDRSEHERIVAKMQHAIDEYDGLFERSVLAIKEYEGIVAELEKQKQEIAKAANIAIKIAAKPELRTAFNEGFEAGKEDERRRVREVLRSAREEHKVGADKINEPDYQMHVGAYLGMGYIERELFGEEVKEE